MVFKDKMSRCCLNQAASRNSQRFGRSSGLIGIIEQVHIGPHDINIFIKGFAKDEARLLVNRIKQNETSVWRLYSGQSPH